MTVDADRIDHMIAALQAIRRVATSRRSLQDEVKQAAVLRWFEVLGEAAKGVTPPTRERAPEIPWKAFTGLRTVLIHGYDQVDLQQVWGAVEKSKDLLDQLVRLRKGLT